MKASACRAASDSSSLLMPENCALAYCVPGSLLIDAGSTETETRKKKDEAAKALHKPADCLTLVPLVDGSLAVTEDAADVAPAPEPDGWLLSSGHSNTQRSFESISFSGYFFHRSSRLMSSSSGFTIDCTMNLCLFFSFESNMNGCRTTALAVGKKFRTKDLVRLVMAVLLA
uniref:Uncharacterized protein n=1 Tax=Anopheles farauti TaxID=69004 RepID=A0A182QYV2_9DIPT